MYKLELTEEEHEFLKFCMETILSTDWYASAECMEMAEALQEKLQAQVSVTVPATGKEGC